MDRCPLLTTVCNTIKSQAQAYPATANSDGDTHGIRAQFAKINELSGWTMDKPGSNTNSVVSYDTDFFIVNNKLLHLFWVDLSTAEPTNTQLYNLNLQSAYRIGMDSDGSLVGYGFIWKKFFESPFSQYENETTIKFLHNLRSIFNNYIAFLYPELSFAAAKFSIILAVSALKCLGVPFTPQTVVDTFNCTPVIAEDIIDKYDAVNNEWNGLPWTV